MVMMLAPAGRSDYHSDLLDMTFRSGVKFRRPLADERGSGGWGDITTWSHLATTDVPSRAGSPLT
jgi:hypothetical protein